MSITMHKSVLSTEVSIRMSNLYLPTEQNACSVTGLQPGDTTCLECKRNRQNTSLSQITKEQSLSHSNIQYSRPEHSHALSLSDIWYS